MPGPAPRRRVRRLRDPLMRLAYRIGYWCLRGEARVLGRPGRGVKCLLSRDGEILLVRHTYGERHGWRAPGGRRRRGEGAAAAAAREMHEELGLEGADWRELATLALRLDGRNVNVACLHADVGDRQLWFDAGEIADARFFAAEQLPEQLAEGELRVLGLLALPFSRFSGETSS